MLALLRHQGNIERDVKDNKRCTHEQKEYCYINCEGVQIVIPKSKLYSEHYSKKSVWCCPCFKITRISEDREEANFCDRFIWKSGIKGSASHNQRLKYLIKSWPHKIKETNPKKDEVSKNNFRQIQISKIFSKKWAKVCSK